MMTDKEFSPLFEDPESHNSSLRSQKRSLQVFDKSSINIHILLVFSVPKKAILTTQGTAICAAAALEKTHPHGQ